MRPERAVPPVMSCIAWGLPCLLPHSRSGELLPHHFTLTFHGPEAMQGGIFSVALSVAFPREAGKDPHACAWHTALRCPDFPLVRITDERPLRPTQWDHRHGTQPMQVLRLTIPTRHRHQRSARSVRPLAKRQTSRASLRPPGRCVARPCRPCRFGTSRD